MVKLLSLPLRVTNNELTPIFFTREGIMINSSGQQRLRAISAYMDRQDAISVAQQLQQHSRSTRYRLIDIRLEADPADPTRARVVAVSELIVRE
jgi:hypothetical protein